VADGETPHWVAVPDNMRPQELGDRAMMLLEPYQPDPNLKMLDRKRWELCWECLQEDKDAMDMDLVASQMASMAAARSVEEGDSTQDEDEEEDDDENVDATDNRQDLSSTHIHGAHKRALDKAQHKVSKLSPEDLHALIRSMDDHGEPADAGRCPQSKRTVIGVHSCCIGPGRVCVRTRTCTIHQPQGRVVFPVQVRGAGTVEARPWRTITRSGLPQGTVFLRPVVPRLEECRIVEAGKA